MAAPTPQTRLEAVNTMLGVVWEAPVSSLDVTGVASVTMATRVLDDTIRSVQTRGWAFNTEHEYPIAVDEDGFVPLPNNTLSVDSDGDSAQLNVVQRGLRLYDRGDHTFDFSNLTTVSVKIILSVDFADCPEAFKQYVAILAARRFKAEYLSQDEGQPTSAEIEALRNLEEAEADTGDHNFLTDNWAVGRVLCR